MQRHRLFSRIDILLALLVLVLLNLVSTNAYLRFDLTHNSAYSLSRVSEETLARVEDPLRVKVFYNESVPAPYNGVRQYLLDLLREYDTSEDRYFSYEVIDPTTDEGRREAQRYGLQQVEIQEIRSDEFASRAAYLGAVVLYGNVVERVDRITSTDGLEYRLTTAMRSAVTQVDALSGTTERVTMRVIASPTFADLQIEGFPELETQMRAIHERVNADNYERIDFTFEEPATDAEIRATAEAYGLEPVEWQLRDGSRRQGLLEIVLTLGERTERIPIQIFSGLFGGYALGDPADLEESVRQGLRSLVSANPRVAYSTSAGEKALNDFQRGAGPFSQLVGESYEIVPVDLTTDGVPADVDTLVINGPTQRYSSEALYRIDQFVMRGGSLLVLLDRHVQNIPTQQQMAAGMQPTWEENETGLDRLLDTWGVTVTDAIVLDEESFVGRGPDGGRQQLFQAPVISGDGINREQVVTAGLEDLIVLNATEILPVSAAADEPTADGATDEDTAAADADRDAAADSDDSAAAPDSAGPRPTYTALMRSSRSSWTVEDPSQIGPWIQGPPAAGDTAPRDVAVLLEGRFASAFDGPVDLGLPAQETPDGETPDGETADGAGDRPAAAAPAAELRVERYRPASVDDGRVILISASALTTPQMLDAQSRTPNGTFLMNAVDYLNGAPGIAELRSKGLGVPRLSVSNPASRVVARWANTILVPALVLVAGLAVWSRRRARARRIQQLFAETNGDAS